MDNTVYVNTQQQSADPTQPTETQDLGNQQPTQWIAVHNLKIIGMYGSQAEAVDGLSGYKMQNKIDLNDVVGVYQII
jgi:hypothetical protein